MGSLNRKAKRESRKRLLKHNNGLVDKFCETEKYSALAERIVAEKVDKAMTSMTKSQLIHELRVAGCVSGLWMLALKDVYGFHTKRLQRVYERVMDMMKYLNENRRRDQNVADVIEAVAQECGFTIDVPNGINDNRPLLIGGRAICYGPLLASVQIAGHEVALNAVEKMDGYFKSAGTSSEEESNERG